MRCKGRGCDRMAIVESVWDYDFDPGSNLVDVYIMRLREKIDGRASNTNCCIRFGGGLCCQGTVVTTPHSPDDMVRRALVLIS